MIRSRRSRRLPAAAALAALALLAAVPLGGCSDDDPTAAPAAQAPVLPDPQRLTFDFGFFDAGAELEKAAGSHENFVNAYLRAVVLGAMADLTLATPVTVFAAALHHDPVLRDDGAWVWSYAWSDGRDALLVSLVGRPDAGAVAWELRLDGAVDGALLDDAVWFAGTTDDAGRTGRWSFHDLADPAQPVCGAIAWGDAAGGRFLEFTSHEPGSDGDTLRFTDADPDFAIEFTDADADAAWHIRWHADGSGSLRVPDFNGGQEACWDTRQRDADCS